MVSPVLFFRDEGPKAAPAIVLLHSLATHSGLWAAQVPIWASAFRVVTVDLPGHGQSPVLPSVSTLADMAQQVLAVLDHLEIDRAAWVGLSLGGMVAQAAAMDHAHRVSALVIAHAGARTDATVREIWNQRIAQFEAGDAESLCQSTLQRWFPRSFAERAPLTMAWMADLIRATHPAGYVSAIRAIQQLDHLDRLHEIAAPTLVVAGHADAAVPASVASLVADRIPGAQLRLLEETGHIGNVQAPSLFTEAVGGFLQSTLPFRAGPRPTPMETLS